MRVEAFIIVWNEIDTIEFTIKHYQSFCDRVTFYDNHSDDGTAEAIEDSGCILKRFGKRGVLDDSEYIKVKNSCWKTSKADWVIVCDSDEIIWADDIKNVLDAEKGNTIFKTIGRDMYSNKMPVDSFFEIQHGIESENYSKTSVFSPKLQEINYVYGCHVAHPKGHIRPCKQTLNLWHFRNIGGPERLIKRHELYRNRLSPINKRWGLGIHYTYEDERRKKDWQNGFDLAHSNGGL